MKGHCLPIESGGELCVYTGELEYFFASSHVSWKEAEGKLETS